MAMRGMVTGAWYRQSVAVSLVAAGTVVRRADTANRLRARVDAVGAAAAVILRDASLPNGPARLADGRNAAARMVGVDVHRVDFAQATAAEERPAL